MKINLNIPLLELDEKTPIRDERGQPIIVGKLIANQLISYNKGDAMKFHDWAISLYKGDTIDLVTSDQEIFKTFVKESDNMTNLVKSTILKQFILADK